MPLKKLSNFIHRAVATKQQKYNKNQVHSIQL